MTHPCEYCGLPTTFGPARSVRFEGLVWPACCAECVRAEVWRPIHEEYAPPAMRGFAAAPSEATQRRVSVADEAFYHEIVLRLRPPTAGLH